MKSPLAVFALSLALALSVSSCGNALDSDHARTTLTSHQRDSVLAKSALPGAGVVGRALQESGRAATRSASMNAGLDSLDR